MNPLDRKSVLTKRESAPSNTPFYLVLFYLLLEFGRPQDIVPGLGVLSLPMLTIIGIGILLFSAGKVSFGDKQTKLLLALLALMVLHGPIAVNNFHALMTFKAMALTFVGFLGIIRFVDSVQKLKTLATVWLGVHAALAVLGMIKGGQGVGGWMGDENDFCMQLNMVVSFAYFGYFAAPNAFQRWTCLGLLCTYVSTIILTLSRGGFIGLLSVGLYCWLLSSRKVLSAALIVLLVGFMFLVAPSEYWTEIESIGDDKTMDTGTGGERMYTWEVGWDMFLANPIIGVGQGNFQWVFDEYEAGRTFHGKSIAGRVAHSAYFTLLPELGLVGTFLFVGILVFTRKDLGLIYKSYRAACDRGDMSSEQYDSLKTTYFLGRAMEASIIGYLVSSIFIATLYYPSLWIMIAFVIALRNVVVKIDSAATPGHLTEPILSSGSYRGSVLSPRRSINVQQAIEVQQRPS